MYIKIAKNWLVQRSFWTLLHWKPTSPHVFHYFLQSTKCKKQKVVGFTYDLKNELLSFNNLSRETISYQPYALMAFAAGFKNRLEGMKMAHDIANKYGYIGNKTVEEVLETIEKHVTMSRRTPSAISSVKCCNYSTSWEIIHCFFNYLLFLLKSFNVSLATVWLSK